MNWLMNNYGNIIVSLLLIVMIEKIISSMIKDRKRGKSSCGCNCAHCALAGKCHNHTQKKLIQTAPSFKA